MTQPQNLDARITALQAQVSSLQSSLSAFTTRFTALEQELLAGRPRLAALEEAARGFETRVQELEGLAHAPSNADAARLSAVEERVALMASEVTRISQVSRPARSVVREQLTTMQAQVEEILSRLPAK